MHFLPHLRGLHLRGLLWFEICTTVNICTKICTKAKLSKTTEEPKSASLSPVDNFLKDASFIFLAQTSPFERPEVRSSVTLTPYLGAVEK